LARDSIQVEMIVVQANYATFDIWSASQALDQLDRLSFFPTTS